MDNFWINDGHAVLALSLLTLFLIPYLFITFSLFAIRCTNYYKVKRIVASRGLQTFHVFVSLFAGAVAAAYSIRFAAFFFAGVSGGIFIHTILAGLCSGVAFFLLALSRPRNNWINTLRMAAFSLAACIATISLLGILLPYVVLKNAANIAKGQPYCIALQKGRRPVENIQDMAFLTMDKSRDGQHAVLLIAKAEKIEAYGWSYLKIPFTDRMVNWDNQYGSAIHCLPEPAFGDKLSLLGERDNSTTGVFLDGKLLKMNKKYSPKGSQKRLSISAQAPDFKAVERKPHTLYPSFAIRSRDWIENLHKKYENNKNIGEIGDLTEIITDQQGLRWYYRKDKQDHLMTTVGCHITCQHRFYRDDRMYYFEHSHDLLEQSAIMEDRLYNLFQSFEKE